MTLYVRPLLTPPRKVPSSIISIPATAFLIGLSQQVPIHFAQFLHSFVPVPKKQIFPALSVQRLAHSLQKYPGVPPPSPQSRNYSS